MLNTLEHEHTSISSVKISSTKISFNNKSKQSSSCKLEVDTGYKNYVCHISCAMFQSKRHFNKYLETPGFNTFVAS